MITCDSCGRHIRTQESACPFCAAPSTVRKAMQIVGAGLTTFILAACYGTGAIDETGSVDADGDASFTPDDCDDNNAAVNPSAAENCTNTIDDNCDGLIDAADPTCSEDSAP